MWPIITTSAFGSGSLKKLPRWNCHSRGEAVGFDVVLEDGRDLGQIEADPDEMRILEQHLREQVALRRPDVDDRLVLVPGELRGDGDVRAAAHAGHAAQKDFEPLGIGIECGEDIGLAARSLVLRQPGTQSRPSDGSSDRTGGGWPSPECRRRRTACACRGTDPLMACSSRCHRAVPEIPARPGHRGSRATSADAGRGGRPEAPALRAARKLGEDLHLDGAQQSLRSPEGKAGLQDMFRAGGGCSVVRGGHFSRRLGGGCTHDGVGPFVRLENSIREEGSILVPEELTGPASVGESLGVCECRQCRQITRFASMIF